MYNELISKLKDFSLEDLQCRSVLSHIILFDARVLEEHGEDLSDLIIVNKILFDQCLFDKAGDQLFLTHRTAV